MFRMDCTHSDNIEFKVANYTFIIFNLAGSKNESIEESAIPLYTTNRWSEG